MSARLSMRAAYVAIDSGSDHVWPELSRIWRNSLSADTRAKLALAAMYACEGRHAEAIAEHVTCERSQVSDDGHAPVAPLYNYMDEAAFWADLASGDELAAYCLASFNRMAPRRQADFLSFVQGRTAA